MATLAVMPVQNAEAYAGNFPKMSQPKEVACYSRDGSRQVRHDRSGLRPYRPPSLPAALDVGFEQYIPKAAEAGEPAPLGDILGALAAKNVPVKDFQIVTYRNNLNKIFLTPYARRDDWEIGVEKREDGVVLLQVRETARKQAEEAQRDERSQRMAYWGYRFEQLATLSEAEASAAAGGAADGAAGSGGGYRVPSPSDMGSYDHLYAQPELGMLHRLYEQLASAGGSSQEGGGGSRAGGASGALPPVNANEEFCSIVHLSIDKVRLLMAAEVDCTAERAGPPGVKGAAIAPGYVELKTSKQIGSAHDLESFERHKLVKFWLQSFLAGVPSIIVGFRDEKGVVCELKTYETKTIHRIVRGKAPGGKDYWNPTACFNFGKGVLDWLLMQLAAREGGGVGRKFVLRYDPQQEKLLLLADEGGEAQQPAAKRQRSS